MTYSIIGLSENPEMIDQMADWFHDKWGVPREAYYASMKEQLTGENVVPRWYAAVEGNCIIGGMGVIENDFHERKDLTPNVCAVFTEPDRRGCGIAGALLEHVGNDMKAAGIDTLYLVTDHTAFYERYGWEFYCMVNCDGGEQSRLYIRKL